jgi:hypothetical protein
MRFKLIFIRAASPSGLRSYLRLFLSVLYFALPSAATTDSVCAATFIEPGVRTASSQHSPNVSGAKKALIFIRQRAYTAHCIRP